MKSDDLIKIKGRSGCKIEISQFNPIIIRKYSKSIEYNQRLNIQKEKQQNFNISFNNSSSKFKVPYIYNSNHGGNDSLAYFEMEYINGSKFSDYFLDITISQLTSLTNELVDYLYYFESTKIIKSISPTLFSEKLVEISKALIKNNVSISIKTQKVIEDLIVNVPSDTFPFSYCHGDLTFSNMIFKKNCIYIYDFLDSYLDSYLIDIVKLRQDTNIYWSLFIDSNIKECHKTKLMQILNFIDNKIDFAFYNDEYYTSWYTYLQKINLLRILPYLCSENEIKFIEEKINKL